MYSHTLQHFLFPVCRVGLYAGYIAKVYTITFYLGPYATLSIKTVKTPIRPMKVGVIYKRKPTSREC
jgi:hypothetical protein